VSRVSRRTLHSHGWLFTCLPFLSPLIVTPSRPKLEVFMSFRRIAIDEAIEQFLTSYAREHTPGTVRQVRIAVEKFHAESKVQWIDGVSWYHVKKYEAAHHRQQIGSLRTFLRWCSAMYRLVLPFPPVRHVPCRPVVAYPPKRDGKAHLWTANAKAAAGLMALPHQKLIFMCGYLYGMPLATVVRLSLNELCNLPMRQDFYDLLEGMRYLLPASGPAFKPWLGRSVVYARRVWRDWSGGVSFTEVICAGDAARIEAGIRPVGGRKHRMEMLDLLPPASTVLLDRMPKFWAA
jgi:hypothetical protein